MARTRAASAAASTSTAAARAAAMRRWPARCVPMNRPQKRIGTLTRAMASTISSGRRRLGAKTPTSLKSCPHSGQRGLVPSVAPTG